MLYRHESEVNNTAKASQTKQLIDEIKNNNMQFIEYDKIEILILKVTGHGNISSVCVHNMQYHVINKEIITICEYKIKYQGELQNKIK